MGRKRAAWAGWAVAMAMVFVLGGCSSSGDEAAAERREEGEALFGDTGGRTGGAAGGGERAAADAWTIVVATFGGEDGLREANEAVGPMRAESGLTGLFVEPRKKGACIAFGKYASAQDAAARRDLERVRGIEIRGLRPFGRAFLAPPVGGASGSMPELNLARVREEFGSEGLYTLQVAVYESPDRAEAKRAAERAAFLLRQEGEMAFYYHGPLRSMVTVGVFGSEDIDLETQSESAAITALRERYPHNLYNGAGLRETVGGRTRLQPSQLVQTP